MAQSSIDDPTAAVYSDDDGTGAAVSGASVAGDPVDWERPRPDRITAVHGMDLIILAGVAMVTGAGFALRRGFNAQASRD